MRRRELPFPVKPSRRSTESGTNIWPSCRCRPRMRNSMRCCVFCTVRSYLHMRDMGMALNNYQFSEKRKREGKSHRFKGDLKFGQQILICEYYTRHRLCPLFSLLQNLRALPRCRFLICLRWQRNLPGLPLLPPGTLGDGSCCPSWRL